MKKYLIIILALSIVSCGRNYKPDYCACNFTVRVPENIFLNKDEVYAAISQVLKENGESRFSAEIIILSYSSGKEVFSLPEDNPENPKIKTYSGNISALLKIKQGKVLQKVLFLKAGGNSREEILKGLAKGIEKTVCYN